MSYSKFLIVLIISFLMQSYWGGKEEKKSKSVGPKAEQAVVARVSPNIDEYREGDESGPIEEEVTADENPLNNNSKNGVDTGDSQEKPVVTPAPPY